MSPTCTPSLSTRASNCGPWWRGRGWGQPALPGRNWGWEAMWTAGLRPHSPGAAPSRSGCPLQRWPSWGCSGGSSWHWPPVWDHLPVGLGGIGQWPLSLGNMLSPPPPPPHALCYLLLLCLSEASSVNRFGMGWRSLAGGALAQALRVWVLGWGRSQTVCSWCRRHDSCSAVRATGRWWPGAWGATVGCGFFTAIISRFGEGVCLCVRACVRACVCAERGPGGQGPPSSLGREAGGAG